MRGWGGRSRPIPTASFGLPNPFHHTRFDLGGLSHDPGVTHRDPTTREKGVDIRPPWVGTPPTPGGVRGVLSRTDRHSCSSRPDRPSPSLHLRHLQGTVGDKKGGHRDSLFSDLKETLGDEVRVRDTKPTYTDKDRTRPPPPVLREVNTLQEPYPI